LRRNLYKAVYLIIIVYTLISGSMESKSVVITKSAILSCMSAVYVSVKLVPYSYVIIYAVK